MQWSICEVQSDYQEANSSLKRAKAEKDDDDIILYEIQQFDGWAMQTGFCMMSWSFIIHEH